jgi:hypothetical protein
MLSKFAAKTTFLGDCSTNRPIVSRSPGKLSYCRCYGHFRGNSYPVLKLMEILVVYIEIVTFIARAENTKGGSITVLLTSCLTALD